MVFGVSSDNGEHTAYELGSDHVEHRHGMLSLCGFPLVVPPVFAVFHVGCGRDRGQVEQRLDVLVRPLRDLGLGMYAFPRGVSEGCQPRVAEELPRVLEPREAHGDGDHVERHPVADAVHRLEQLHLTAYLLVRGDQLSQLLVKKLKLFVERLDDGLPHAALLGVVLWIHEALLVVELALVPLLVLEQHVPVGQLALDGGERAVGHAVGHGLVGEAVGVLGDAARVHLVVLAPRYPEGVLDPRRVLHPEEKSELVAGAHQGIDVPPRELGAHDHVVRCDPMVFHPFPDGLLDGRYRVRALVFPHALFLFSQADVHFFLADVDADLMVFHNIALLFADFGPPSPAHKPYRFWTHIPIRAFGTAGAGRSKKVLGSFPFASVVYRPAPLSLVKHSVYCLYFYS